MNIYTFISIAAGLMPLLLGIYILRRDPRATLNRVFFAFCLLAAIDAFGELAFRQAGTASAADILIRLTGFVFILIIAVGVHFALVFTENRTVLARKWPLYLLYGLAAAIFIAAIFSPIDVSKKPWGFDFTLRPGVVSGAVNLWAQVPGILPLILILFYFFKTTGRKRRQTGIVLLAFTFPVLFGTAHFMLAGFGIHTPKLTNIGQVLFTVVVAYAISKYELFLANPESWAVKNIMARQDYQLVFDNTGRIVKSNDGTNRLLGYDESGLPGQSAEMIFANEDDMTDIFRQIILGGAVTDFETEYRTKTDRLIPVLFSGSGLKNNSGEVINIITVADDISQRKRMEEVSKHTSYFDRETSLPNRRVFENSLTRALSWARQNKKTAAVIILEAAGVNGAIETYGQKFRIGLMKKVGERLSACVSEKDMVAYLNNRQFGIVLAEIDDRADAERAAWEISERMTKPFSIEGKTVSVSIAAGISIAPDDGDNVGAIISNAQVALFRLKEKGEKGYFFYSRDMRAA